ncbi:MAG: peptidyl-prolyl cis-trans isomerase [Novosphingobium lindaniclasticum]|jgi:peptidyl-prolyl cis-trans isomerase A (cyclophilin A)|uniref:peptidylprolyl isomerase n=1 Tax=Novosphingobium lindaniclasticum TaxID=1329895 RepID=UPI0024094F5F|nr:peptidylprolyl isomerase [Novosphingobium lindaniclasticum]MDF2637939.1 peptidyl-prolyl cis-trans isomerase [Novosphingobium lindaniclasticum]
MARSIRLAAVPFVVAACAALAGAASAQDLPPAAAAEAAVPVEHVYVALTTSTGVIVLDLDKTHAPLTVANFLKYVDGKRFDGATFYRAMHLDWGDQPSGLLQGGLQGVNVFPPVAHEPTDVTGISHKAGTISMARFAPGSATADFTIMLSDIPSLDAQPASENLDSRAGFAAFGHVVSGMDVVRRIWDEPRSPTKGEGVMKGQILEPAIKIVSARRVPAPPPAS